VRAVLDTNVVISGIFFGGTPGRILAAWRAGRFRLVTSPLILDEYRRVARELGARSPGLDIGPILDMLTIHAEVHADVPLDAPHCRDPHDDKFLSCAEVAGAVLVSGDKDLLAVHGRLGVRVLSPAAFAALLRE
jgi:putative PIN family toxin of toxin-antitoxin system